MNYYRSGMLAFLTPKGTLSVCGTTSWPTGRYWRSTLCCSHVMDMAKVKLAVYLCKVCICTQPHKTPTLCVYVTYHPILSSTYPPPSLPPTTHPLPLPLTTHQPPFPPTRLPPTHHPSTSPPSYHPSTSISSLPPSIHLPSLPPSLPPTIYPPPSLPPSHHPSTSLPPTHLAHLSTVSQMCTHGETAPEMPNLSHWCLYIIHGVNGGGVWLLLP